MALGQHCCLLLSSIGHAGHCVTLGLYASSDLEDYLYPWTFTGAPIHWELSDIFQCMSCNNCKCCPLFTFGGLLLVMLWSKMPKLSVSFSSKIPFSRLRFFPPLCSWADLSLNFNTNTSLIHHYLNLPVKVLPTPL